MAVLHQEFTERISFVDVFTMSFVMQNLELREVNLKFENQVLQFRQNFYDEVRNFPFECCPHRAHLAVQTLTLPLFPLEQAARLL